MTWNGKSRTVQQLHYTGWPDHGAPGTTNDLLTIHSKLRELDGNNADNGGPSSSVPIIVHCSAGVGRTGTLIGLDNLAMQVEGGATGLDVFKTVYEMREDRCKMVSKGYSSFELGKSRIGTEEKKAIFAYFLIENYLSGSTGSAVRVPVQVHRRLHCQLDQE